MSAPVLVIFGSGPGISAAVAKLFAQKHFTTIALVARNGERLATEKTAVERAAGRNVNVYTFAADMSDIASLGKTLIEVEKLGPLGLVYHNAARINPAEPLKARVEELEEDLKVSSSSL